MSSFLDNALVALALLSSVTYAVLMLGPRSLKKRVLGIVGRWLKKAPKFLRLGGAARRLADASTAPQGACGGCDNCGTESSVPQSKREIKIPLAKISRRP